MRIGLIADTHIRSTGERLPSEVLAAFRGCELILHAGDVYLASVLDELEAIAPVLCARGNGDIALGGLREDPRVKDAHVLEVMGKRLGLVHALEYPMPDYRPLPAAMATEFGGPVDILVFGHSHVPVEDNSEGTLLVNPGSPTLPWGLDDIPGSVAILEVLNGKTEVSFVEIPPRKVK